MCCIRCTVRCITGRGISLCSDSAFRIKGMFHLYLPALQPCVMGTGSLQGMSWQTGNKLLLTKGTPLFLLHESCGILCDTSSLGLKATEVCRSAADIGHQAVVGRWSLERTSTSFWSWEGPLLQKPECFTGWWFLYRVHCFLHWPRLLVTPLPAENISFQPNTAFHLLIAVV